MDTSSFLSLPPEPERRTEEAEGIFQRTLRRVRSARSGAPKQPGRGAIFLAALVVLLVVLVRFSQRSLRPVAPGYVGVCVSSLTGTLQILPPGTHFRPRWLYEIHPVRISDQLLAGPDAKFAVSTKEGVAAVLVVQARWAVDRERLLSKWASLPSDPGRELVAPVLASAFRTVAPAYEVSRLSSEKREELALHSARRSREALRESGILLKEVLIADLTLSAEYERGRVALVDEIQHTERMEATLKLKAKEVEKTRLEAEAQRVREEKNAESAAAQRLIAAKGEAEAMKFVLALKEKEIDQKKLEGDADKETRLKRAQAEAAVLKIQTDAEAVRRKAMADAEAYAIRTTSLAQFEGLKREAELVQANPLLIPKTFADRLSDKVQVILTPTLGGEAFTGEVLKRVANGKRAVAAREASDPQKGGESKLDNGPDSRADGATASNGRR